MIDVVMLALKTMIKPMRENHRPKRYDRFPTTSVLNDFIGIF